MYTSREGRKTQDLLAVALESSNPGCDISISQFGGRYYCVVTSPTGERAEFEVLVQDVELFPDDLPQSPVFEAQRLFRSTGYRTDTLVYSPSDGAYATDVLDSDGEIIGFLLAPNGASGVQDLRIMVDEEG